MKQFEIICSRCGKRKRIRPSNFIKTSYQWENGGGTLICPECARECTVIASRDRTLENMVLRMFAASEPYKGD